MYHRRAEYRGEPGGGFGPEGPPDRKRSSFRRSLHGPQRQTASIAPRCAGKFLSARLFALVELCREKARHRSASVRAVETVSFVGKLSPFIGICALAVQHDRSRLAGSRE